jgi:hypothetical protein
MAFVNEFNFYASTNVAAAGTTYSTATDVSKHIELLLFLRVTAQGTYTDETLNITMQTKDHAGNWYDLTDVDFTEVGDVTGSVPYAEYLPVIGFGSQVRFKIVAAGTGVDYTFSITGYGKGVH